LAAAAGCRECGGELEGAYRFCPWCAAPQRRKGRIFIDYLRNGRGTTAVAAYSPRARRGFPIAAPVTWAQLMRGIPPDAFTIISPFKPRR
jgi:bifunctional non-homologous end joining protein LigD